MLIRQISNKYFKILSNNNRMVLTNSPSLLNMHATDEINQSSNEQILMNIHLHNDYSMLMNMHACDEY